MNKNQPALLSLGVILILVLAFKSSVLDANNIPSGSMLPTLKIGDFLFVNKMRYSFRIPFAEYELFRYDDPKRGDIVTFIPPDGAIQDEDGVMFDGSSQKVNIPIISNLFAKRFVKRVVGMPGDEIRISQRFSKTSRGDFVYYTYVEFKEKGSTEFTDYHPIAVEHGKELTDLDNTRAIGKGLFKEVKPGFEHFVLEGLHSANYTFIKKHCPESTCKIPDGHYMVMGDNRDDSSDSRFWGFVKRENILGKALILYFSINWKDYTCMFKEIPEDNDAESVLSYRYDDEEVKKSCHPSELGMDSGTGLFGNIERWVKYRIPRMQIRWKRIGRILK